MKPSEIFLYGCAASSVALVGVGLIEALKPDNRVSDIRRQRMTNDREYVSKK